MSCQACYIKNQIIEAQQKEIQHLRQVISEARGACVQLATEAEGVMSSNQPRGKWAFAKGALKAAQAIQRRLSC